MVVIRNLTEDLKFDAECYLYWLHDVSEKDISTEGYVGISLNPDTRCRSHESNFQKRREGQYLDSSVYDLNDIVFEVVHCGSQSEVEDFERTLRPTKGIGWNRGAGGGSKTGHFECYYEILGEGFTLKRLSEVFGIDPRAVHKRVSRYNQSTDEALQLITPTSVFGNSEQVCVNGLPLNFLNRESDISNTAKMFSDICESFERSHTITDIQRETGYEGYVIKKILKSLGIIDEPYPAEFLFNNTWVKHPSDILSVNDRIYICDAVINRDVDVSIMADVFSVSVGTVSGLVKKGKNTINGKVVNKSRYYSETMLVNGKVRHLNESIFNEHLSTLFDLLKVGDVDSCKDYLESHNLKYDSFRKYLRYTGLNKEL